VTFSAGTLPDRTTTTVTTGFGRALVLGVIFAAALVGGCALIHAAMPFPKVLGIYQKWLYFQRNKEHIDVLFLGSSRVYHQVIPKQFDAQVKAATGREIRSFNAAYDAMWPPESLYNLRQLLAMRPGKLRWVVLECLDIFADLPEEARATRRTAYWHDFRHTAMAWDGVRDMKGVEPLDKWNLRDAHLSILIRNWTNQGRGAEWLSYEFGVERRKKATRWDPPEGWRDREGYEPERDEPIAPKEWERLKVGAEARAKAFPPSEIKPSLRRAYEEIIAEIRKAGAEPIILGTPTVLPTENFTRLQEGVEIWSYHDPNLFPALYEKENRHDYTHLNDAGAKIFTDLLARRFAEYLGKKQP